MPYSFLSDTSIVPNTILIVDDDEINRDILSNIFETSYSVQTVENGKEGLDAIEEYGKQICAIILDVVMPVMDGIEVLEILNENNVINHIPVFLITGETDEKIVKRAYELGVMDVIRKPISSYIVRRRVNSVIELFMARKRLSHTVDQQQIQLSEQAQKIIKLTMGMIESLSTAIEFRSGESGAHVRKIYGITKLFLENTKFADLFSAEQIEHISLASIMHDVGKISIPDTILNKPGRFTPEEFEIMKTHTTHGGKLLERIPQMKELPFFKYACDIAKYHHERWDGRGYPEGLVGNDIPLGAQIVSIADVYDALVSPRCYKKAFSFDVASEMIVGGQCGQFNPELLECFQTIEHKLRTLYAGGPEYAYE
ncbi:MAG: response regulator [Desulfovibrionaceae bacterium]|nr:response regulator [Desulfovibrionaceae bacterium]